MSLELAVTELDFKGIYNNIVANALWVAAIAVGGLVLVIQRWIFRRLGLSSFFRLCVIHSALFVALYIAIGRPSEVWAYCLALIGVLVTSLLILRGYIFTGISGVYLTTEKGIGYKRSLEMANHSIDFLGIGGDKLTSLPEFVPAMRRCAVDGREVRFLLSPPSNTLLETLARRNNTDPKAYEDKVKASLRRIAEARKTYSLNIKVKFYPVKHKKDLQLFRLMFINNSICLWSWTIWGAHAGYENPQVILSKRSRLPGAKPAYRAFADYFENVWIDAESEEVDLDKFL